jgi:hypothetical protein
VADEDRTGELIAVLEVLGEWVESVDAEKCESWTDEERESFTAAWQAIELSLALLSEYSQLHALMVQTINERETAKRATRLVVAAADGKVRGE